MGTNVTNNVYNNWKLKTNYKQFIFLTTQNLYYKIHHCHTIIVTIRQSYYQIDLTINSTVHKWFIIKLYLTWHMDIYFCSKHQIYQLLFLQLKIYHPTSNGSYSLGGIISNIPSFDNTSKPLSPSIVLKWMPRLRLRPYFDKEWKNVSTF